MVKRDGWSVWRHADGGGWAKCDRCNVFGMDHSSDKVMAGYMDRHDKARHNERG